MRTFVERLISRWAISASQRQLHSVILCALDVCDFVLMRSCLGPREATWDKLCTTVWCIPTASVLFFAGASPAPSHLYVAGQFMKSAVVPKPYSYYLKLFDKATASIANTTDPEGFHPAITGTPHSTWLHRHTSLYFTATLHFTSLSHYFTATPHSLTVTIHFFLLHSHTSLLHFTLLSNFTATVHFFLLHNHTSLYFIVTLHFFFLHCHTSLQFTSLSHFTSFYLTVTLHFFFLHCHAPLHCTSLSYFTSLYFTVALHFTSLSHFTLLYCHTSLSHFTLLYFT